MAQQFVLNVICNDDIEEQIKYTQKITKQNKYTQKNL